MIFTCRAVAFDISDALEHMASRRSQTREDVYVKTLRLIEENPRVSQRDIARRVGISVGTVHYCLTALAEKGLIKLGNFSASKNKRNYIYILTPEGISAKAQLTLRFLSRKVAEYEALKAEIAALECEVDQDAAADAIQDAG